MANTSQEVQDDFFELRVGNCFKMKRKVEILQWIEHTQKNKKETIVRYELSWRDSIVNSNGYRVRKNHENDPLKMKIKDEVFRNEEVFLGARKLDTS